MPGLVVKSPGVCTDRTLPMRNPLWTPALLPGRAFDLDCGVGCAIDGNNRVTSWTDQAQRLVLTPSGGDGALKSDAAGGLTAPRFTLDGLSAPTAISATAAHWCFWAMVNVHDTSAAAVQMLLFAEPFEILLVGPGGPIQVRGPNADAIAGPALSAGQHVIVLSQQVAGTQQLRVDGAFVGAPQTGCAPIALGVPHLGLYDPGLVDTGIFACGFVPGVQAIRDIQKLEGYLAARFPFQLPPGEPFAAAPPRKRS